MAVGLTPSKSRRDIARVEVNTNPVLVGAATKAFLRLRCVICGLWRTNWAPAGHVPGPRRERVRTSAAQKTDFVDLNRDELCNGSPVQIDLIIERLLQEIAPCKVLPEFAHFRIRA